jgi:hypothetical protein
MHGCDGVAAGIGNQDGHAVGNPDGDRPRGIGGDDRVGARCR